MASNPVPRGGEAPNSTAIPIIQNIFGVSSDFLGQLRTWLEQNPPSIPVTQILGFTQFAVQLATSVETTETTVSDTYADLATVGPTLTGLSDGKYLVLFGCSAKGSIAGSGGLMGIATDTAVASDNEQAGNTYTDFVSVVRATTKTLSNGNNTITAKYRRNNATGTASFAHRWLIALRYANP